MIGSARTPNSGGADPGCPRPNAPGVRSLHARPAISTTRESPRGGLLRAPWASPAARSLLRSIRGAPSVPRMSGPPMRLNGPLIGSTHGSKRSRNRTPPPGTQRASGVRRTRYFRFPPSRTASAMCSSERPVAAARASMSLTAASMEQSACTATMPDAWSILLDICCSLEGCAAAPR